MKQPVLIIIPYSHLYPPVNGGMQRCFHLLNQLCKEFDVTLITQQPQEHVLEAAKEFPAIAGMKIHSTQAKGRSAGSFPLLNKISNAIKYRWYKRSLRGPADSDFLLYYPVLKKVLSTGVDFKAVVLEKLATLNAISIIRRYSNAHIIYDAHNVDTHIAKLENSPYLSLISETEKGLHKTVNSIFACSPGDLNDFVSMNEGKLKGMVIPNGVHLYGQCFNEAVGKDDPVYIMFCGSLDYAPNYEGLYWFNEKVWKQISTAFPSLKLLVVGSGNLPGQYVELAKDTSFVFTGMVKDVKEYYNKASVVIVPIQKGSGTRLKVLEAMGCGVPIVSTSKGAEGISYTDGENILISDDEPGFAGNIKMLLSNKQQRVGQANMARQFVMEHYDWDKIGITMNNYISGAIKANQ